MSNNKTNILGSTKWNYYKERRFTSNYFIFGGTLTQYKKLYKELI